MAVDKERVRLLVDALRSGEYVQGRGSLAHRHLNEVRYCCLGVACEVAMKNGLAVDKTANTDVFRQDIFYDGESGVLPRTVMDWYGFNSSNPPLLNNGLGMLAASAMNDSMGEDFPAIANAFEKTYLSPCEQS